MGKRSPASMLRTCVLLGLVILLVGEVLAVISLRAGLGLQFWINTGAVGAVSLFVLWLIWFGVYRRFRFSLRSLLLNWTVIALGLSVALSLFVREGIRQRSEVLALREAGASVHYSYQFNVSRGQQTVLPNWVPEVLRIDTCYEVERVRLSGQQFDDDSLECFERLPGVKRLVIENTKVTDAGMKHLQCLQRLERLRVSRSPYVTEDGLLLLRDLPCLESLELNGMCLDAQALGVLREALTDVIVSSSQPLPRPVCCAVRSELGVEPPTMPLAEAIASFNQRAASDPVGATQPPLTEEEVLAAIHAWNPDGLQTRIDPKGVQILKRIGDTGEFPGLAEFQITNGWSRRGSPVTVWWVDLSVHTSATRGNGLRIRETIIGEGLPPDSSD